jgi:hypothetical protein
MPSNEALFAKRLAKQSSPVKNMHTACHEPTASLATNLHLIGDDERRDKNFG